MHIAVTWDISDGVPTRAEIERSMIEVLKPYSWARPLSTYYIVETDLFGRQAIYEALLAIAQRYPTRVRFLTTPVMQGAYAGYLNQTDWDPVNGRAK